MQDNPSIYNVKIKPCAKPIYKWRMPKRNLWNYYIRFLANRCKNNFWNNSCRFVCGVCEEESSIAPFCPECKRYYEIPTIMTKAEYLSAICRRLHELAGHMVAIDHPSTKRKASNLLWEKKLRELNIFSIDGKHFQHIRREVDYNDV